MLILTEKPSVADAFRKAVKDPKVVITNCVGHLYELQPPEFYNPEFKPWAFKNLPIIPATYQYLVTPSTKKQALIVTKLLQKHSTDKIIIATDADREGEIIARIVLQEAGVFDLSKCYRFWVSEALTPEVIHKGLEKVQPWRDYDELAKKGFARQHADWLVGMNLSPFITLLSGGRTTFPVGRVQTAILAAVAQRNKDIQNFKSEPFYECAATLQDNLGNKVKALLVNPDTNKTVFTSPCEYIESAKLYFKEDKTVSIKTVVTRKEKQPPQLFDITGLQQEAAKKYNYSSSQTLAITQKLYEEHKCVSYPRTPSVVLGDDDVSLFFEKFELLASDYPVSHFCDVGLINKNNKRIFNSKKLDSHHALIPLDKLSKDISGPEKNIYNLVLLRFFLCCMPPCVYDEKKIDILNGAYLYRTTINSIVSEGWKAAADSFN